MRDPDLSPAPELGGGARRAGRRGAQAAGRRRARRRRGQGPAVGARARPPRRRARRAPTTPRRSSAYAARARRCTTRRTTSTSAPAPSSASASGCAGPAAAPTRASRCAPRSPPSTRSARTPWAERASAELRATGETARRRDPSSLDELTPQELRIALMLGRRRDDAAGRGGALPQPEDRRVPPAPRLPEARRELPRRAGGGAPGRRGRPGVAAGRGYGRASSTTLNGVSAARRTRVKPALPRTSRRRASPAWAPSARPTSWESELGVHSSVENA